MAKIDNSILESNVQHVGIDSKTLADLSFRFDVGAGLDPIAPKFIKNFPSEPIIVSADPEHAAYLSVSDAPHKKHTRNYLTTGIPGQRGESPAIRVHADNGQSLGNAPAIDRVEGLALKASNPKYQRQYDRDLNSDPNASTVIVVRPVDGKATVLKHRAEEPNYALAV